jgi:hypothetical protein
VLSIPKPFLHYLSVSPAGEEILKGMIKDKNGVSGLLVRLLAVE